MKKLLSIVSVLALTGQGCLFAPPAAQPEPAEPGPVTSAPMWAEVNGVVALDQRPGSSVTVSSLIVAEDGWVVIHKEVAGKPGPVIGETYIAAGEHTQIGVSLREATVDGETYFAMLHRDDGDRRFDLAKDAPVRSTVLEGIIMASFTADADAGDAPIVNP
ncbi:hypothetical protein EDM68_02600 [Candidatus Uhrbacteria bacterium]|nr:MAG: hypothetical protein EDM68_02600 [Candidatus Uhrbacteria bacterium]